MLTSYPVKLLLLVFLLVPPLSTAAATPQLPDQAPGYVVDLADVLDEAKEKQLNDLLRRLEQQTTAQLVILTVDSLGGQDINTFSLQTAEQWKIGQKGKDNGLLFVVALQDRKYRFEVGYGLEAVLPDSMLGSIGRKVLVPFFKQGQYGEGISAATGVIVNILAQHYGVTLTGLDQLPKAVDQQSDNGFSSLVFFLFVLFAVLLLYSRSVNKKMRGGRGYGPGGAGMGPVIFPGGGWGGGFSGGLGGFSGGGGGFGGGGASGGW